MTQIVTIINFKGGVGKTTCAVETATALARHYGKRTLLVDLDPQASATFYVMEQIHWKQWRDSQGTVYHLFDQQNGHFPIRKAIVRDVLQEKSSVFGFDLLPSDPNLVDIELHLPLSSKMKKDELVSKILARTSDRHSEQFAIHEM